MFTSSNSTRAGFPATRTLLLAGGAVLCVIGLLYYFLFDPARVSFFPPCLFHQLTGLDCPGCGAQRALHQLLHGHLIAALRLNAMFVLSLPLLAWFSPRFISQLLKRQPLPFNTRWLWVYLEAWVVFAIMRNLPFPACTWFAA